jgi:hypothetical protein
VQLDPWWESPYFLHFFVSEEEYVQSTLYLSI